MIPAMTDPITDALARDGELAAFAKSVTVIGDPNGTDLQAEGEVSLVSGQVVSFRHDLDAPLGNQVLKEKLSDQGGSAIGEKGRHILGKLDGLDGMSAADLGALLAGAGA